jgi:trk system potassium uptake protein TrkA
MILVVGCGRLGASFAQRVLEKGGEVTVLDYDRNNFAIHLPKDFKGRTVAGMEIDTDVLRRAGIEEARAVVIVSRDESTNMMVADVARHVFGIDNIIVRIDQPQLLELYRTQGFEVLSPIAEATDLLERRVAVKGDA